MEQDRTLILIDEDMRRRAAISHSLYIHGIHVEPFETVEELEQCWPRNGAVLIHDTDGAIALLIDRMVNHGELFPIIAFSAEPSPEQIVSAILEGANEYLVLPFDHDRLLATLGRARSRSRGLGNARLREAMARGRIGKLTDREREVLDCVAGGMSNRMIGEKLAISPRTVEIHRANMLTKLGADHTSQAIRIAIEAELVV